jgi:hypothetical protein
MGIWERVIWAGRNGTVVDENPNGRTLSAEELELERKQGHMIGPVGVGSDNGSGSGKGMSSPVRGNGQGIAR